MAVVANTIVTEMLKDYLGLVLLIGLGVYIYSSFAFMYLGKRAKIKHPGLAWIPGIGSVLVAFFAMKKAKATPWWILIGSAAGYLVGFLFIALGALVHWLVLVGLLLILASAVGIIYFAVHGYIWTWKLFEKVKRPGWWALIPLINLPLGLLGLVPAIALAMFSAEVLVQVWYLVMAGVAAWAK